MDVKTKIIVKVGKMNCVRHMDIEPDDPDWMRQWNELGEAMQMAWRRHKRTADGSDLLSAAMSLVGKLKIIHGLEEYRAVWTSAQIHRGPYKGPKYDKELAELERAITDEHRRIFPEEFHSENTEGLALSAGSEL